MSFSVTVRVDESTHLNLPVAESYVRIWPLAGDAMEFRSAASMLPSVISELVMLESIAREPRPRLALAPAAVVDPVPPFAIGRTPDTSDVRSTVPFAAAVMRP